MDFYCAVCKAPPDEIIYNDDYPLVEYICINAVVKLTAEHYGYQMFHQVPDDDQEWSDEADDAIDYLDSLCPHGYWFEFEDNSLFLRSEDD